MLKKGILTLRRALKPSTCRALRMMYETYRERGSQRDYNFNRVVFFKDLPDAGRLALGVLAIQARDLIEEWTEVRHEVESVFLGRLNPGNVAEPHYDNVKIDGTTPNHTPYRTYSSLFYLSGGFEGGEITFPNQNLVFKPGEGDFIAFPSGAPYLHFVQPVKSGLRYAAPVWFTNSQSHVLQEVANAP